MAGIFPHQWDGGIPPNAATPDNPANAFKPGDNLMPPDTSPLYYGNGCDTRIRAPVLNAIISELVVVMEYAGVAYNAGRLNNLAYAITLIAQRGGRMAAEVDIQQAEIGALHKEIAALKAQVAVLTARIKVAA